MKKRLFGILLVLCMMCLLSLQVDAAEIVANGSCGEEVSWSLDSTGKLTITGTAGGVQASREIAATCSQGSGTETRCMLCGATRLDITGKPSGHTPKTVPGIGATCQSEGLSDGSVCADCGEVLQVQTVLPKTPHTELSVKGHASTCIGEGITDGLVCTLCGEVLKQQSSIPALGHTFEVGFCTRCGEADPDWILPGDANGDGVANYSDALIVLRSSIGLEEVAPNVVAACDMNSDGQLNYSDALIILRRSIGLE